MLGFPHMGCACLLAVSFVSSGCGRIGFDLLALDTNPTSAPDDAGAVSNRPSSDPNAAGEPAPLQDASLVALGDAARAADDDAGSVAGGDADQDAGAADTAIPDPPLGTPGPLSCGALSGVLACDPMDGVATGESLNASGGPAATANLGGESANGLFQGVSSTPASHADVVVSFSPVSSGNLYVRARLGMPSDFAISDLTILSLASGSSASESVALNLTTGDALGFKGADGASSYGLSITRDRWLCIDVVLALGDQGRAIVFVDGLRMHDVAPFDTLPSSIAQVAAGIWLGPTQDSAEIFVDELAVSTSPLPTCP